MPISKIFFFLLMGSCVFHLSGCFFIELGTKKNKPFVEQQVGGEGENKILLLDISGMLSLESVKGSIGLGEEEFNIVEVVREQLDKAGKDDKIKAVVLRINSPGGEVTASDILYHELAKFRKDTGKILIANIVSIGASGGYYVAMAADKVLAHPTSIVGSIGVLMMRFNAEGLLEKIGVESEIMSSGTMKEMGSPFKRMNAEEKALFQEILNFQYQQFVEVVATGRKMSVATVRPLADGRVYTSQQAKNNGLIDEIGYLEDALTLAKKEAKLASATYILYQRPGSSKNNIYNQAFTAGTQINLINLGLDSLVHKGTPAFFYFWNP